MTIDTTNMCSHLQKKLFEPEGVYYPIWQAMQDDETLTAVVRSRQLHIYRNGKKILVLAGKAQPKIIREDKIQELITRLQTKHQIIKTMDAKEKVLATMKEAGQPLNAGKIAELSGLDRKEVDAAMKQLKAEGAIVSPVRCKWAPAE